jgi:hypothetical protein
MKVANARKLDRKSGVRWGEHGAPVHNHRPWLGGGNADAVFFMAKPLKAYHCILPSTVFEPAGGSYPDA